MFNAESIRSLFSDQEFKEKLYLARAGERIYSSIRARAIKKEESARKTKLAEGLINEYTKRR